MEETRELPRLPFDREGDVIGIAPMFRRLRPVTRVLTSVGDPAWLVSGYAEAKALFADERVGRSHPAPAQASRISNAAVLSSPLGEYEKEKADRTRIRRLLTPAFSARRMHRLREHIEDVVATLFDALAERAPAADLHRELAAPLPSLVICELLGVPYADRADFTRWSAGTSSVTDLAASQEAHRQLLAYIHSLIDTKRKDPGEDVISDLVAAARTEELPDDAIAMMGAGLLFAGHETTVTRIDFGALLLLTHPEQRDALRRDPDLLPSAVEEILRYSAPSANDVLPRYAHADVGIGGVTIPAGDAVLLSFTAADRDPREFAEPDTFDITRKPNPHLAFGHGPRFCIGASLARVQLQSVFGSLFTRFPTLELAVPLEQLRIREDSLTGGLTELPVRWRP